jgi:uncharacterized protein
MSDDTTALPEGLTLSTQPQPLALDGPALYAQGLQHLRTLARQTWTDHNLHDPGITVLELASHALADLAYRAALPLPDLLRRAPASAAETAEHTARRTQAQFHAPADALPNAPLTLADWRKLLIDLPDIKNAWVEPDTRPVLVADLAERRLRHDRPTHALWREVPLRGLLRVRVEFMERIRTAAQRDEVLRQVALVLQQHRSLCEDFTSVTPVRAQYFALCAEIELTDDASAVEAAAQLLFAAAQALAPAVQPRTLQQMLDRALPDGTPRTLPDCFDGPLLQHGFIDDTELQASVLPAELRLSDLMGVLTDVPGVRVLRDVVLNPLQRADEDDEDAVDVAPEDVRADAVPVANRWRVPVRPGRLPRLSLAQGRLVFSKRGIPLAGWNVVDIPEPVRTRLTQLREAARLRLETPLPLPAAPPLGVARDLAQYRSFQLDFPPLYGVGDTGLPGRPDAQRRAQVLQLKGYLLLFDQLMADRLALLAQAAQRHSVAAEDLAALRLAWQTQPEQQHALAAQVVRTTAVPMAQRSTEQQALALEKVYPEGVTASQLAGTLETAEQAAQRQLRTLDHLLARSGEDLRAYRDLIGTAFAASAAQQVADTVQVLQDIHPLARDRAQGYVQRAPATDWWNSSNTSGLELRLARLLGMPNATRRNLSTVSHDVYAEADTTPADEWRWRLRHRVSGQILLSATTHYASVEAARAEMMLAVQMGQDPGRYSRRSTSDGRFHFVITNAGGDDIARRIQYFETEALREEAIGALMAYLREHYSGEGLYVIEHLLLRPQAAGDPLMPICTDGDCGDCTDLDPYSYRVHVVLPAYAGRLQHAGYRQFVEETVRREMPAHVLPTVCFIDSDSMARLEAAYRRWIEMRAGADGAGERVARTQDLIDALLQAKNVYPQRRLFDCTADGDSAAPQPPFVLGRTALGSLPPATD